MTTLSDLYRQRGPFGSVVVRMPSAASDAAHRMEIRWKNARRDLEAGGASESMLGRFDGLTAELEHGQGEGLAAIISDDAEPLVEFLLDDPARNTSWLAEIPTVTPIIESRQRAIPHVVVFIDRSGADIVAVAAGSIEDYVVIEGEVTHIHRGHQGGWSQRRFQQRAENLWDANAHEVADAVTELARRVGARLISVSGDVRAVGFLTDRLPGDVKDDVVVVAEGAPSAVWEATDRAVEDLVQRESDALVDAVADRRSHRSATTNVRDVMRALGEGRVETLLVHDDRSDGLDAWFGPGLDPMCSLHHSREDLRKGRLVDVCVRSALLTDARVRVVPSEPSGEGPIAALLRW
ncbi:MAG: Vms1/Ankzf1 family peptidyl-tRNA hydrolase [Ilumatobacter sp.]|uniref:baeRF2 domain-containing protein n=1 Tax=Ilumatobacter sp. TaxID=1967498 RepID=UPI002618E06D|nr:Vms1/Ankzf1 family peptidyl-tRNA hydrolase [Ilumatobacter sp.]MDJ0768109.1 Vms1/Ankzf1 family peptidyl-tRNA hydrolase [Ilumatobacter sp.]